MLTKKRNIISAILPFPVTCFCVLVYNSTHVTRLRSIMLFICRESQTLSIVPSCKIFAVWSEKRGYYYIDIFISNSIMCAMEWTDRCDYKKQIHKYTNEKNLPLDYLLLVSIEMVKLSLNKKSKTELHYNWNENHSQIFYFNIRK